MFGKKRRIRKYIFKKGISPQISKNLPRYNSDRGKTLSRISPTMRRLKRIAVLLVSGLLLAFVIHGIFFSGYFRITEIKVSTEGEENETLATELKSTIEDALGGNIIFTDTDELETKILNVYPEIEKLSVSKDYPNKLVINFTEYPLVANVINESSAVKKSYIINKIGYAIKENFENPSLPYIRIKSDEPLNVENPIIEVSKLTYILDTITYFEDKFGMRIIEVLYKKIPREIHLLTEKNFYIWLDMQNPAEDQLKKLKKALVKVDIYTESLQYVDLRIAGGNGDKIIYKRR